MSKNIQSKPTYSIFFELVGSLVPAFKEMNGTIGVVIEVVTNLGKTDIGTKLIQFIYSSMVDNGRIEGNGSVEDWTLVDSDTSKSVGPLGIDTVNTWASDFAAE